MSKPLKDGVYTIVVAKYSFSGYRYQLASPWHGQHRTARAGRYGNRRQFHTVAGSNVNRVGVNRGASGAFSGKTGASIDALISAGKAEDVSNQPSSTYFATTCKSKG
jgi:hypothetical protein